MSNETTTAVAGNLTADPVLRGTATGRPVAQFTVVSTSRVMDSVRRMARREHAVPALHGVVADGGERR